MKRSVRLIVIALAAAGVIFGVVSSNAKGGLHDVSLALALVLVVLAFYVVKKTTPEYFRARFDSDNPRLLGERNALHASLKQLAEAVARDPSICGPDPVNVYAERALALLREIDGPQKVQSESRPTDPHWFNA